MTRRKRVNNDAAICEVSGNSAEQQEVSDLGEDDVAVYRQFQAAGVEGEFLWPDAERDSKRGSSKQQKLKDTRKKLNKERLATVHRKEAPVLTTCSREPPVRISSAPAVLDRCNSSSPCLWRAR